MLEGCCDYREEDSTSTDSTSGRLHIFAMRVLGVVAGEASAPGSTATVRDLASVKGDARDQRWRSS